MTTFFETKIEFLKGVGPQRAELLHQELRIFTFGDLLGHYPFRYEDRTRFFSAAETNETMPYVQLKGKIVSIGLEGGGRKKRLVADFADGTGSLELVWFQGINWALEKYKLGVDYVVFGKPNLYGRTISIAHPEIELLTERNELASFLQPVYPLTEKLKAKYIDSKLIGKLQEAILKAGERQIRETLPESLRLKFNLIQRAEAVSQIHFPQSHEQLAAAQVRLKFEELFYIQLRLLKLKLVREEKFAGQIFTNTLLLIHLLLYFAIYIFTYILHTIKTILT